MNKEERNGKIRAFIILAIMLLLLAGIIISSFSYSKRNIYDGKIGEFIIVSDYFKNGYYTVYHEETRVMYLYVPVEFGTVNLCPLYNEDGTLMTYKN